MRFSRLLTAAALVCSLAAVAGCAPEPPPVSQKVQDYYDDAQARKATPVPVLPVAAFLGDSYTQGTGASSLDKRWVNIVGAGMGWNVVNLARGGTGYVATSDVTGCGLSFCPNYPAMVPEVVNAKPAVVLVTGGQNDFQNYIDDPAAVADAVHATFYAIRSAMPEAQIVAVGPSSPFGIGPHVTKLDRVVQDAAAAVSAKYVSLIEPNVITEAMVLPDKAHVNDAGHAAISERVLTALR